MPKRQRTSAADEDHAQEAALTSQPFEEQELVIKMSLLPSAMEDLAKNVQTRLTGMLMRYHEDAGGVILGLSSPQLPAEHPHAAILDDMPFLHVHVTATALVFKPAPGLKLQGEIIKVAGTHIALLVYGIFNAAIAEEDMSDGFKFHPSQRKWADSETGQGYKVGDSMQFTVKRVHEAGGLISIDGSLRPEGAAPRPASHHGVSWAAETGAAAEKHGKKAGKKGQHKPPPQEEEEAMEVDTEAPPPEKKGKGGKGKGENGAKEAGSAKKKKGKAVK